MGREKRDITISPAFLKIGLAVAFSIGGMLYTFLRNKRITRSRSSSSSSDRSKSSDCNNQGITVKESKSEDHASQITPNCCRFDPLATNKSEELHNSILDLSPSCKSDADKDAYLLPEFNDLVKEFDMAAIKPDNELQTPNADSPRQAYSRVVKASHEQEITSLRNMVKTLKEREQNLETQLLEYYGLKEQQTAVTELQNRLKLNNMEAKLFALKIKALQTDNARLQSQMADHAKVVADLESAQAKIKVLKKKLRVEAAQNKERISDLRQRVQKMKENEEEGGVGIDPESQSYLGKLKDLEAEAEELRELNYRLEVEKTELGRKLERVQIIAGSGMEDEETEKLKQESERLKKQNEDLTKEIEQLQSDRCGDIEELVYLRWINACLRYELRNHQPEPGKTMARDLSNTLSPKSEAKAKQLILEYAKKGINIPELDSDHWSSSPASNLTDAGELDDFESFINDSSPRKNNNKFFGKVMNLLRGKDHHTPDHHHHHHHHDSHSRNLSLEDTNTYSESSFAHLANSSKHSMDSQRSIRRHRRIDSIAEDADIGVGGSGSGSGSPSSSDCKKGDLVKYAEVLKDSDPNSGTKFRRRSRSFSSF